MLVIPAIRSPKNGYAYVYLSNESNEPVYFDNFAVGDSRGRIIEEDHYCSFGLKIAGISSRKLDAGNEGSLKNNNLCNDKELFDDADLDWYDYGFRNYDAQIGRFTQLDPLTDSYPELTPYQYASNEPIANIDEDGLESVVANVASDLPKGALAATKELGGVFVSGVAKAAPKVASGFGKTALKVLDIATNFIPIVGGVKDIYNGIESGDGLQIAMGVGSVLLDIFTLGSSSVAEGEVKTAVKETVEWLLNKQLKT